jgi:hypothetical protein
MTDLLEQVNSEDARKYSLEAILAEYKSEAFIRNERRLSKEELEKQAEAIIREMRLSVENELREEGRPEEAEPEEPEPEVRLEDLAAVLGRPREAEPAGPSGGAERAPAEDAAPAGPAPLPEAGAEELREARVPPEAEQPEPEPQSEAEPEPEPEPAPASPPRAAAGEEGELYASLSSARSAELKAEVEKALGKEERRRAGREARKQEAAERKAGKSGARGEKKPERGPELSVGEALNTYASGIPSLRRRTAMVFVICSVMALLLFAERGGVRVPLLLPDDRLRQAVSFLMLLLAAMLLGVDTLVAGVEGIFGGRLNPASLSAFACLASVLDAVTLITGGADWTGQPYCAAAACTLLFNMLGEKMKRTAWRATLKTLKASRLPTVVSAEERGEEGGTVLRRRLGSTAGFISKCGAPSAADGVYALLAPC